MSSYSQRMYARYADVRPEHRAPATPADLLTSETIFRKVFAPLLPRRKDASILDIGCGYGEFLYFLQCEGYTRTQGIDLNSQQVRGAESLGVRNVRCGDCRELLCGADETFHFISAIDVLEHVPKPQLLELLDLIRSALSPGGVFLCQVPNLAAFFTPSFFMDFSHETPFTGPSLKQVLELAGFRNVKVSPRGPVAHGVKSTVRLLLWKGISASLRFIQTVEGGPRDPLSSMYTAAILGMAEKH